MAKHADNVPTWVRITVGFIALLSLAFGIVSYFDMRLLFHSGTGIDLANPSIKNAGFEFAARNLAIGLALVFVTIIRGAPEALVILTIIRALIEFQTIILSIIQGDMNIMLIIAVALLVLEICVIKSLIAVIKKEEAQ
jgi:hypothetical protein